MNLYASLSSLVAAALLATAAHVSAQEPARAARSPASIAPAASESVKSRDGTEIAYERAGEGPVLVLVGSALADRSGAARLASLLAPSFTVINYDRRGRGRSGDTQPYAVQREIEDIEALIDASGGSAYLFGSSSGAVLALEAAHALAKKVRGLIVFEPPFVVDDSRAAIPESVFTEIDELVRSGRRGDAVAKFMTVCVEVPEPAVAQMRQAPMWAGLEEHAHTLRYDGMLLAGLTLGRPLSEKRWTRVPRALVLDGSESPPHLRNAARALGEALHASRRTLAGHDHGIVFMAPEALVEPIVEFVSAPPAGDANGPGKEARDG